MRDNLTLILQKLHHDILCVRRCSADLRADTPIELADSQTTIRTGVIYLVTETQAPDFLSQAIVEPGAYLMVSDVTVPGRTSSLPPCDRITVVEFRCCLNTLFNILSKALSAHFRKALLEPPSGQQQDRLLALWRQIRSQTLQGSVEIREQLRQLCPEFKPYVRLLVIVSEHPMPQENWDSLLQQLRSVLPGTPLFIDNDSGNGRIIGIQFFDQQNFGAFENQEQINQLLTHCGLRMMISNASRDFSKLNTMYSLTRRAGLLAERLELQPKERIYQYERYSMYLIIDMCTQRYMSLFNHSDIIYLVHPVVVHLTRYDEKHRTNLRDVLFYYLQNSQDLKRTAETLYMHRNTVANKINQIRSICDIDFDDGALCLRLLFSCQVILYYEKVLQQRLSRSEKYR